TRSDRDWSSDVCSSDLVRAAQLQERLKKYGPNALPEEKKSALSVFLPYFWGPIPWMIEAAALMALIVRGWGDFTIITALLLFNEIGRASCRERVKNLRW